jgi:hypothetical protein
VRLAGKRVALSPQLAALLIAADVDRLALSTPKEGLMLPGAAQRRATKMTMNLDRLSPFSSH